MQVTQQNPDALNAVLHIKIEEADYTAAVEAELKTLKGKAFIPGFRPGKVPSGMIRKMYGKSVLSEELGKLTTRALYDYIEQNNIKYLGEPMIRREEPVDLDQKEFEFYYDLGLMPVFDLKMPAGSSFTHQIIQSDEASVEKELTFLRERYGRTINVDEVGEKDLVSGMLVELNEAGEEKEGGINKSTYFFLDRVVDEETKAGLLGKKAGDVLEIDPRKAYKDDVTVSIYLGIDAGAVPELSNRFRFSIESISRVVAAELNQEFFDRLFGESQVTTEEECRTRVADYLKADLQAESTAKLFNELRKAILEVNAIELPDAFLKRWIVARNEGSADFNPDNIENEYAESRGGIVWEVIRTKIVEENQIDVPEEELLAESRRRVISRLSQMGYSVEDERVNELARRVLSQREEAEKIINYLYEVKSLEFLKNSIQVNEEHVAYNDFLEQSKALAAAQ